MSSCIITDSQRLKGWRSERERERERDREDDGERMAESKRQKKETER